MAVQVLDLMSLHYGFQEFIRPKLILAILALIHLQASGLIVLNQWTNIEELHSMISYWAENQSEFSADAFQVFK